MLNILKCLFIIFLTIYAPKSFGQDSTIVYSLDLRGVSSTAKLSPFWIHANKNGSIPNTGNFLLGQVGLYKIYNQKKRHFWGLSAGILFNGNISKSSEVFFQDLYVAGKAGPVEILIGQKAEFMGLVDSTLSVGSLALSQNFRPYPKIQISTPHFTRILKNFDFIKFKFSYADGLLGPSAIIYGNVSQVADTYLHHKSLYIKLGTSKQKLNLIAGFNHQAMWGGEEEIFSGGLKKSEAYKYVVKGKPWAYSRVGNHFGTIDLGAEIKLNKWDVFVYRQNIFEDGSLAQLSNIQDGLNGLRLKNNKKPQYKTLNLSTILFEFLYTKSQGGDVFDFVTGKFGHDNYYNHYVYSQGWSYKGLSLGTPLIDSQNYYNQNITKNYSQFTVNNRIYAFNLGLEASYLDYKFQFKGTYSQNFGSYALKFPTPLSQSSLIFRTEKAFSLRKNNHLSLAIATDFGKLYPSNAAIMFGWKRTGFLK